MTNTIKRILSGFAAIALFVGAAAGVISCNNGPTKIDYTHNGSAKLKLSYQGRNFFKDGIGQVTVKTYIDGDTTHFLNVNGDTSTVLKSRYFGIDTPESTGNIQEYGKQASNFTKEKLSNAAANGTIVVASPFSVNPDGSAGVYQAPEADSTGSRYLSMVWINEKVKNAPVESLVLLNLWIVQEGLSWSRIEDEEPFADTFFKAQQQAEKLKLKMWSGQPDPLFNYGDYETIALCNVKDEMIEFLTDEEHSHINAYAGAKVRFTGVVAGYSDRTLYVQERYIFDKNDEIVSEDEYDPAHPELYTVKWAGINIFTGMSPIAEQFTDVGAYIEVIGKAVDDENFGFQVTDTQGKWLDDKEDDESCYVILSSKDNQGDHALKTFEYTPAELNANLKANNFENLYCRTRITTDLVCTDAFVGASGDEMTLEFEGCDFSVYAPFLYRGNPEDQTDSWMSKDNVIGKTFSVSGVLGYHKTSDNKIKYQIIACNESDLVCKTPKKGTVTAEQFTVSEAVEAASTAIPNVRYYVNGKAENVEKMVEVPYESTCETITIAQALELIKAMKDGESSSKKYYIKGKVAEVQYEWSDEKNSGSYVVADEEDADTKITFYGVGVKNGISGPSIGVGDTIGAEGKLKKYAKNDSYVAEVTNGDVVSYYSDRVISFDLYDGTDAIHVEKGRLEEGVSPKKVLNGSTLTILGVPSVEDGNVSYNSVRVLDAKLHGQVVTDPLNVTEAYNIANELESRAKTDDSYYMIGEVTKIVYAYDTLPTEWHDSGNKFNTDREGHTNRICFVISDGTKDMLIWGARMGLNKDGEPFDYTQIVVGAELLVMGKLMKNNDGVLSTYYNGSQVLSLVG